MKEDVFTKKVEKYLQSKGIYKAGTHKQDKPLPQIGWYFVHWGGGMSQSGIPDIICNINGYFVSLELKGTKGKPSKLQEINTECINTSNGIGRIVYPKDFEEVKELIGGLIK